MFQTCWTWSPFYGCLEKVYKGLICQYSGPTQWAVFKYPHHFIMGKIHNSVYDNDFIIKICGWKSVIKNKENRILLSKVWSFQYLFILKNRRDVHISVNIAPRTNMHKIAFHQNWKIIHFCFMKLIHSCHVTFNFIV